MRYEYKFETVEVLPDPKRYRNRIVKRAGEGWRLVQILVETHATPNEYVLVLERQTDVDENGQADGEEDEWVQPAPEDDDS